MNILVYTSIYPLRHTKKGFTPVVKYFCEEWVKLGHRVIVISSTTRFPYLFYMLPNNIEKKIESKLGFNLPNKFERKTVKVEENEVYVYQLPIKKYRPGSLPDNSTIEANFKKIKEYLNQLNFIPDIAVGHWLSPQLQYLRHTKEFYKIPVNLTLHSLPRENEIVLLKKHITEIDGIGFRNHKMLLGFNELVKSKNTKQFLCLSGVKDYFNLSAKPYKKKPKQNRTIKVSFVGNLIQRKHPDKLITAINNIEDKAYKYHIDYVGDGKMKDYLQRMEYDNQKIKLTFHGRLSREETYKVINQSDILVMISEREAYGLVYLEAMINRTIPIASFNEGFDGIIKDGVNGFLVQSGDDKELSGKLRYIMNLDDNEYYKIQESAFNTAINMTDELMAIDYLNKITHAKNKK